MEPRLQDSPETDMAALLTSSALSSRPTPGTGIECTVTSSQELLTSSELAVWRCGGSVLPLFIVHSALLKQGEVHHMRLFLWHTTDASTRRDSLGGHAWLTASLAHSCQGGHRLHQWCTPRATGGIHKIHVPPDLVYEPIHLQTPILLLLEWRHFGLAALLRRPTPAWTGKLCNPLPCNPTHGTTS